jgi:maltokinase
MTAQTDAPDAALLGYLSDQRWFAGKGGESSLGDVQRLGWLPSHSGEPRVRVELISVETDGRPQLYQVPVAHYDSPQDRIGHALIGVVEDADSGENAYVYDALHDKQAVAVLVRGFITPTDVLEHRTLGDVPLDDPAPSVMISGEQSNTSLVLGGELILKVFRKLDRAGTRHRGACGAQRRRGGRHRAAARLDHRPHRLRRLRPRDAAGLPALGHRRLGDRAHQRPLAADGPDLDPDHSEFSGGDFASEAERLGAVTARLHAAMRSRLATDTWGAEELEALRQRLTGRLEEASSAAPELNPYREKIALTYAQLGQEVDTLEVQRVHGDLHLGQTLRSVTGWVVLDFEGEPAKPLSERTALDSPLRDVAGMLRSFDYAAHSVVTPEQADEVQDRAMLAWVRRNREAFLAGYAGAGGVATSGGDAVLRAYELDKAVYEVVYETHNADRRLGGIPARRRH